MKNIKNLSENFHFLVVKFSIYSNRHVFVMNKKNINTFGLNKKHLNKRYDTLKTEPRFY